MIRFIARELGYALIMLKHKILTKGLKNQFRAKATFNSYFEGENKLSHNSFLCGALGYGSYIGENSTIIGKIGRYCSIGGDVTFLTKTHPVQENVSTHPSFYSTKKQSGFSYVDKQLFDEEPKLENSSFSIEVGNDVYIGYGVRVIGPCRIGNGAVIAAGAVVTESVPDYAIVGGVPAKIIRYRFPEEDIKWLLSFKWWDMPKEWLAAHAKDFKSVDMLKKECAKERKI